MKLKKQLVHGYFWLGVGTKPRARASSKLPWCSMLTSSKWRDAIGRFWLIFSSLPETTWPALIQTSAGVRIFVLSSAVHPRSPFGCHPVVVSLWKWALWILWDTSKSHAGQSSAFYTVCVVSSRKKNCGMKNLNFSHITSTSKRSYYIYGVFFFNFYGNWLANWHESKKKKKTSSNMYAYRKILVCRPGTRGFCLMITKPFNDLFLYY